MDTPANDNNKVHVVKGDFKANPSTFSTEAHISAGISDDDEFPPVHGDKKKLKKKANKRFQEAEAEGLYLWDVAKQYLLRPGVAGGLIGIVNVGLLAGVSRAFYINPHYRSDTKVITYTVLGSLALLSTEGYAAEAYAQTPAGRDEARRAKEEGTLIYKHTREVVLRPGVLGGLVGLLNAGILGTVGYYSYINWDKPTWDRRTVSAVSVGLLTLATGEGFLAERVRKN